jgi:hypothetical protein
MAAGVFRLKPLPKMKGVKDFKVRALTLAKPVGGETSIDLRDDKAKEVFDRLGRQHLCARTPMAPCPNW